MIGVRARRMIGLMPFRASAAVYETTTLQRRVLAAASALVLARFDLNQRLVGRGDAARENAP